MGESCISCGNPLGSRSRICYSCKTEQEENGEYGNDSDIELAEVADRVERYIHVSCVRCSDCGDIHSEVSLADRTVTAETFGIESESEWRVEMDTEEEWLQDHTELVQEVLPQFTTEWPQTVSAIKTHVL